ncbi:MAG: HEAT repeat domain-containing protein [Thermomicrobium sp.]|nr:HEAT repeat domain-containing protein [Thermomicrobium sp.]
MHGQDSERYDMALIEGLAHPRPDIAEFCAWILGERRVRAAVPALIAALERRTADIAVQAAIARALGRIGDPAAFPALLAAAERGAVTVRRAALEALDAIDHARARPFLERACLSDPSPSVRAGARWLLEREVPRDESAPSSS